MSWCGYSWTTWQEGRMIGSHECRAEHPPEDTDPVHVCARCFSAPDIDKTSNDRVDSLSENTAHTPVEDKMPKLDNATARRVNKAEGGGSAVLDEDRYRLKLEKVAVSPKPDKNGDTYWNWTFSVVSGQTTGDKFKGKSTRTNTWFTEERAWFPRMIFDAFEVKPNIDTDEILGREVYAIITQSEITSGQRKGQMGNDITTFESVNKPADDDWDDDDDAAETKADDAADDDEPEF